MGMISRWLSEQSDEVLGRLARVEPEDWNPVKCYLDDFGGWRGGCLICHATGSTLANRAYDEHDEEAVEGRYMILSNRFGKARVGRAISARARKLLAERERENRMRALVNQYSTDVRHYHEGRMRAIGLLPTAPEKRPSVTVRVRRDSHALMLTPDHRT